ncbi:hypothetical protein MNBD_ALPHA04-620 [hydrothermal vent metagenome]|uniref:Endonuclease n=1 Tax=hydrothermal vent metagenome TaxID=652676 RepID=A0A3B0RQV1_9ZZZZ
MSMNFWARMTAASLAGVAFSAIPLSPVSAWSEETHMTTGAIAYDDLVKNNPATITALEEILKAHPHYDKLAGYAEGFKGEEKTRVMFQWLARWPDDINGTEYEHRDWHYELRVVHGRTWLWPFRNGNATLGFDESFRLLADKSAPLKDRAIAISWLMHLTGDIQQPLHAGHQMTNVFWATDEAGSLSFVRKAEEGEPTDLHNYWDKILDVANADGKVFGEATSRAWATPLQTLWPRTRINGLTYEGTPQEQFENWLTESMHLARLVAYTGTYLSATAEQESAPVVTPREIRVAEELSKQRVATGGYRIADVLRLAVR